METISLPLPWGRVEVKLPSLTKTQKKNLVAAINRGDKILTFKEEGYRKVFKRASLKKYLRREVGPDWGFLPVHGDRYTVTLEHEGFTLVLEELIDGWKVYKLGKE